MTRISVITVCFNAATTLGDTLTSVAAQRNVDVEHIVIDGGSTDHTPDVLRTFGQHVARFVSEPDDGLYDAMNKGLALATGDVIAFLNADDWYAAPDCLQAAIAAFAPTVDLVYGDLQIVDPMPPHRLRRRWRDASRSRNAFAFGWQPAHPATFMRTQLLRRVGGFDTRLHIAADYALFARCFLKERITAVHLPRVVANMRGGGTSSASAAAILRANGECLQILRELGAPAPWATVVFKVCRKLVQIRRPSVWSE
jgi:glycosyltransferase involved in cell wall biosynthesis